VTDPSAISIGEELLGHVGIEHSLSGSDKPIRIFQNTPDLADDVDKAAHEFVFGEQAIYERKRPPFDYDQVSKWLAERKEPKTDTFRYLPASLTAQYLVAVQRAVTYLASIFPRETVTTMTTTRPMRPAEGRIARFRRPWEFANDVRMFFRALLDGTLSEAESASFQVLYPSVFDALKGEILVQIAERLGKDRNWTLPYAKDQLLQAMLLTSIDDPAAMSRLQQNFEAAKQASGAGGAPPEREPPRKDPRALETPVQRAAQ